MQVCSRVYLAPASPFANCCATPEEGTLGGPLGGKNLPQYPRMIYCPDSRSKTMLGSHDNCASSLEHGDSTTKRHNTSKKPLFYRTDAVTPIIFNFRSLFPHISRLSRLFSLSEKLHFTQPWDRHMTVVPGKRRASLRFNVPSLTIWPGVMAALFNCNRG
jgi:hypothetical protein